MANTANLPFRIEDVMDSLGMEWQNESRGRPSFNIVCPICGQEGHRLTRKCNINLLKQVWRCPKCDSSGNAFHLYCAVRYGKARMTGSGKDKAYEELLSILNGKNTVRAQKKRTTYQGQNAGIENINYYFEPIRPDSELHATFKELLQEPALTLTDKHKQKLLDRGLDEETIIRNEYRSIPEAFTAKTYITKEQRDYFFNNGLAKIKEQTPGLKRHPNFLLILGLAIAGNLKRKGCRVTGVPGFFKLGKFDCLYLPQSGMLIPSRNMAGEIVGMQLRTDSGNIRYLTLSSKNLNGGVAERISRPHMPLANDALDSYDEQPTILLTEGALKADVALCLLKKKYPDTKVAFVAIPGINTTTEFFSDVVKLKDMGYVEIKSALDMDRTTNVNVARGSRKIKAKLRSMGIRFTNLFWDTAYADVVLEKEKALVKKHKLTMPDPLPNNKYYAIAALATVLDAAEVDSDQYQWNPKSKGIDDYLKNY